MVYLMQKMEMREVNGRRYDTNLVALQHIESERHIENLVKIYIDIFRLYLKILYHNNPFIAM